MENGSIEFSVRFSLFSVMFYIVKLLVCNNQSVLLVNSNYIGVLVCSYMTLFSTFSFY